MNLMDQIKLQLISEPSTQNVETQMSNTEVVQLLTNSKPVPWDSMTATETYLNGVLIGSDPSLVSKNTIYTTIFLGVVLNTNTI